MNFTDFYYYNIGEEPLDEDKEITSNTIKYLEDNGFSNTEMIQIISKFPAKTVITPDDLPESLWEGSLTKKGIYYYHNELHISSKPSYWDVVNNVVISEKYFLEMKMKYTVNDLIRYFYKKFPAWDNFIDEKKDLGAMNYLLEYYSKRVDFVEPVDFMLYLIDEAYNSGFEYTDILELKKHERDALIYVKNKTLNAKAEGFNKIIWR